MASLLITDSDLKYKTVKINGFKHVIVPVIIASLITKGKSVLKNVPDIQDVTVLIQVIKYLGGDAVFENNVLSVSFR